MPKRDRSVEIAIIVPQREEYEAVQEVFRILPNAPAYALPPGGTYVVSEIASPHSSRRVRLAIACMDYMYNYPCLLLTERLLAHCKPKLAFLVGSACGNLRKVNVCDVVITTSAVAYLGRGRRQGDAVNPRPYTEPIDQKIKDAITTYLTYRAGDFNRWNKNCQRLLKRICGDALPPGFGRKSIFEIKSGVIASDDLVVSWSDESEARNFWSKHVLEEARAYDMESAGFSHACARRAVSLGWAVVRGVSDHGVDGGEKYHLAAATIAAEWLRGFITEGTAGLLGRKFGAKAVIQVSRTDLQRLHAALTDEESKNLFVGKRRFIKATLGSDVKAIRVLEYAISCGGIKEFEVKKEGQPGRATTAIRLDRRSTLW